MANRLGMTAQHVIISHGYISEKTFYRSLARSLGLPFTLNQCDLIANADCRGILSSGVAELRISGENKAFLIAPTGAGIFALIQDLGGVKQKKPENLILTTPSNLLACVRSVVGRRTIVETTGRIQKVAPLFSASNIPRLQFVAIFMIILIASLATSFFAPVWWQITMIGLTIYPFMPSLALKIYIFISGYKSERLAPKPLRDHELPTYSILVPLYREANIVSQLVKAILELDYPKAKLDVKFLLEEDDVETISAVRQKATQSIFDIIICPEGQPRTKPRALNFGLHFAKGDYVVVYDAEDFPEPKQLRLAAAYFAEGNSKLGCLQAKLAIDNVSDSWLTRMFALEYARLFDVTIPGMAFAGLPIPLGGTSNHFRRETLEKVLAWDAWNVTEDADLGLRLARYGYHIDYLPSSTIEEAPNTFKGWFDQRTRWMKGWMQTALVHCRSPKKLVSEVGVKEAILVFLIGTNAILSSLFHPLLLILGSSIFFGFRIDASQLNSGFIIIATFFALSSLICLAMLVEGARRRCLQLKLTDIPQFLLYSLLVMAASWRALFELVSAASFWRKTAHGLTKTRRTRSKS